jgi:hypothetical protein
MAIGAIMGLILFIFGVVLMVIAFLATIGITQVIQGWTPIFFTVFGFVLCLTGYVMARANVAGSWFRR